MYKELNRQTVFFIKVRTFQCFECTGRERVNSKSFVSKVLLRIKWNFELTVHFKHEMLGKYFTVTSN